MPTIPALDRGLLALSGLLANKRTASVHHFRSTRGLLGATLQQVFQPADKEHLFCVEMMLFYLL
jgi:hypothetical protein